MLADLHTHSDCSDGSLSPAALLDRAKAAGVTHLAITDHDTIAAYDELTLGADNKLKLVSGIEFSARWRKIGVHIVGLNIDLQSAALRAAVKQQSAARDKRAHEIARKLDGLGFTDTYAGAVRLAGKSNIGRPHFATYLVNSGQVKSTEQAFKKYLGPGKAGDVRENWPEIASVIEWITVAGGTAVLAHPGKYKLTNLRLEELVADFRASGGRALEVVSGKQQSTLTDKLARLAQRNGLWSSCGSDFHHPDQHWADLGEFPALPDICEAVWEHW